jgi:YVTN family beta-propeller protein
VVELPRGTVTFLFTDIEGSTRLLRALGPLYGDALAEHQRILRSAFAAHGGREVDTQGDSFFVAFARAKDAVAAAVDAQRDLAAHSWPEGGAVRVRMGLHTGEPRLGGERYVGLGVHKAARIAAAGHGGQVLLSRTTRELVEDELPTGVTIRDLGERRLKDLERPERLSQLVVEGLPSEFKPLNTLDVEFGRKRRRMYVGSALIGVAAAAVAIPIFALGQGPGGSAEVAPNSLAVIDPQSNTVVGSVPNVGVRPSAIAFGEGAVWVANLDERTLARIDPGSRAVVERIPLEATATGVGVASGTVWLANGYAGTVSRVDPGLNEISLTTPELAPRSDAGSIAVGEQAVWFASGIGTVARIDPSTNEVLARDIVVGTAPSAIAAGEESIWIANSGDSTVSRLNPRTNKVVKTITVGRNPGGIAAGDGAVWVTAEADDVVDRIDAASNSVTTIPIQVGAGPTGIAFGEGAVWVANSAKGTVSRIDPETNKVVRTIPVGNRPSQIAVGNGAVWVTVQAPA